MFNRKAAGLHLLHMCLREGSTNLKMQNVIRTSQSRESEVYGMKENIQHSSPRDELIQST
jgi:hypothetical protein